jgi:GT2 family glycosyltransferase
VERTSSGGLQIADELPLVKVCTVVLNWNSADDTIACVRSVLDTQFNGFAIAVVDNGSTDASTARLHEFLDDLNETRAPETLPQSRGSVAAVYRISDGPCSSIALIEVQENRGYAGGNNVGIQYGLENDAEFVWVLNNDTTVIPSTMPRLVNAGVRSPRVAGVGSVVIDYEAPHSVQYIGGGRFNPWLTRSTYPGLGLAPILAPRRLEHIDYVGGASLFCRADVLRATGGLCEDYFLFYEELDFAARAKRLDYGLTVEPGATVYHRGGATSGAWAGRGRSALAAYHGTRSCFVFLRRWHPWAVPTATLIRLVQGFRLLLSNGPVGRAALRGILSGLAYRSPVDGGPHRAKKGRVGTEAP